MVVVIKPPKIKEENNGGGSGSVRFCEGLSLKHSLSALWFRSPEIRKVVMMMVLDRGSENRGIVLAAKKTEDAGDGESRSGGKEGENDKGAVMAKKRNGVKGSENGGENLTVVKRGGNRQ